MSKYHGNSFYCYDLIDSPTLDWIGDIYFIAFKMLVGRDGDKLTVIQILLFLSVAAHSVK